MTGIEHAARGASCCAMLMLCTALLVTAPAHAVVNGRLVAANEPIAASTVLVACLEKIGKTARIAYTASGIVVSQHLVLTAAHTFSDCSPTRPGAAGKTYLWELRFGTDPAGAVQHRIRFTLADIRNRTGTEALKTLDLHDPQFRDYVFIRIPGKAPVQARPMRLHPAPDRVPIGSTLYVSGYGYTGRNATDLKLRTAQVTLTSRDASRPGRQPIEPTTNTYDREHYLDGYSPTEHPCLGDSGAPIYVVERGQPLLLGMQTQIQRSVMGPTYCDAPVIGMRLDGFRRELDRLLDGPVSARAR